MMIHDDYADDEVGWLDVTVMVMNLMNSFFVLARSSGPAYLPTLAYMRDRER